MAAETSEVTVTWSDYSPLYGEEINPNDELIYVIGSSFAPVGKYIGSTFTLTYKFGRKSKGPMYITAKHGNTVVSSGRIGSAGKRCYEVDIEISKAKSKHAGTWTVGAGRATNSIDVSSKKVVTIT